jgi:N-acetyl-gamma-glutamyl-phosphate reductase
MTNTGELCVGVVGASGYAGQVLYAILMHHPCIRPVRIDGRLEGDAPSSALLDACADCRVIVLATPEATSRAWVAALARRGLRALDLSGAHRRQDDAHYGIPELDGAPPPGTRLVANPGCYPTAALLALRPLLDAGAIASDGIAIVGMSGTSGAGKGLRQDLHFSEMHGNFFPYGVGEHRHVPEIERYLGAEVNFVTQLIPVVRGLMITAFVRPRRDPEEIVSVLRERYAPHPYITVLGQPGAGLGVRHVVGTHQAVLAVGPRTRSGVVPVFASIDNLLRGAASQAVHNLNLWLELPPPHHHGGLPEPMPTTPGDGPTMTRMLP